MPDVETNDGNSAYANSEMMMVDAENHAFVFERLSLLIETMPDVILLHMPDWLKDNDANSEYARLLRLNDDDANSNMPDCLLKKMMMLIQYMPDRLLVEDDDANSEYARLKCQTVCWLRDDDANSVYASLFVGREIMVVIQYMPDCWLKDDDANSEHARLDDDANSVYARLFVGRGMMMVTQYMPDWFNEDDANSVIPDCLLV
ncbi:unnamed protein product [Mytilus edulis]|uniref:Uncharacterized protein n=1 Tax=Mytilus edulis TaxID=6550 RepID=A0A8S3UJG9_MYTED|nr:unnamed protein product [Mytilus edulis]